MDDIWIEILSRCICREGELALVCKLFNSAISGARNRRPAYEKKILFGGQEIHYSTDRIIFPDQTFMTQDKFKIIQHDNLLHIYVCGCELSFYVYEENKLTCVGVFAKNDETNNWRMHRRNHFIHYNR